MTDINLDLVSADGAQRYGVAIKDGAVDTAATEAFRGKRNDDIPLFNFGPSIEEIKAKCKEETGKRPYAPLIDIFYSSDLPQKFFKILLELLHLRARLSTHISNFSARSAFGASSVFG